MRVFNSKRLPKWLFLACFAFLTSYTAQAQLYGVNLEPLCWNTGSVDSTIYVAWMDAAGTTKPSRLHYFNVQGVAVNVSGGTLTPGPCAVGQQLIDNDTIINYLEIISTAQSVHLVSEPGCLVLNDTVGCPVTGLRADISALPAGWKQVYLNDTTYIGAAQVSSCSNFAAALNLIQGTDVWSCCNDSLVVESLDTSAYNRLTFISSVTGDTIIREFADTTGPGFTSQVIPVEIIKVLSAEGAIVDLRYYSSDGATEYTGQGVLSVGPCLPDESNQFYQSVTASLNTLVNLAGGDCDLTDQVSLTSITSNTTYLTNTLNSISILPISGTITVNTGTGAVTLQNGTEYWFGAEGCRYIQTAIVVGVTSGVAQVSRYY